MSHDAPGPWAPPPPPSPPLSPWAPPPAPPARRRKAALVIGASALALLTAVGTVLAAGLEIGSRLDGLDRGGAVGSRTAIGDVGPGDCFNTAGGTLAQETGTVWRVACSEPHDAEVTAVLEEPRSAYPGDDPVRKRAEDGCWEAQDRYAMDTWALPSYAELHYFAPTRQGWRDGDRRTLCVIGTVEEEHRGSLKQPATGFTAHQKAFLNAANYVEFLLGRQPGGRVADAHAEYRVWARRVEAALANEARALRGLKGRAEVERAAAAQLKSVESARRAWFKASVAGTPAVFAEQWDKGMDALSVDTERRLRGALGLSDTVPEWLRESEGGAGGPGGGPVTESA
ncbi:septum formation family protein [Streptomyces sp. NPDC012888]|uniref:septum formation family protein n=1 Tax=Streptomyces sp. NPDC012888 TaxID=3364855 RepID=UPI0036A02907